MVITTNRGKNGNRLDFARYEPALGYKSIT